MTESVRVALLDGGGLATAHTAMDEAEAEAVLEREFGLRCTATRMDTEKDDTFAATDPDGNRYVLKVGNPSEPVDEADLQLGLLAHVDRVDPTIPVPRVRRNRRGDTYSRIDDAAGQARCAWVLTYLPGIPLDSTGSSSRERERVGEVLARLRLATASFRHRADGRRLAWDVRHIADLTPLLDDLDDPLRRSQLSAGMRHVESVRDRVLALPTQVLHNDFSKSNIIVDHDDPRFVTGIIDFGDAVRTAVAVDVSTALLNQLPATAPNPTVDLFAAGRDVLRGYLRIADLTDEELRLIPHLVMARVIARALITLWRARRFPDNATYILRNTEQGWAQLDWFLANSTDDVSAALVSEQ